MREHYRGHGSPSLREAAAEWPPQLGEVSAGTRNMVQGWASAWRSSDLWTLADGLH